MAEHIVPRPEHEPDPAAQELWDADYTRRAAVWRLRKELADALEAKAALERTVRSLRGEVASARRKVADLAAEMEQYAGDHEESLARHERELERLRADLDLLRDALFPVEHVLVTGEPWEPWTYDEVPTEPVDPYADAPDPVAETVTP